MEKRVAKAYILLQMMGRYVARMAVHNMERKDDVPPFERDSGAIRAAVVAERRRPQKHATIDHDGRVRCIWCLKTSTSAEAIKKTKCQQAGGVVEV